MATKAPVQLFTPEEIAQMLRENPDYREPCRACGRGTLCWCVRCVVPQDWSDVHYTWECHACRVKRKGVHHHQYRRVCACGHREGTPVDGDY